MAIRISDIYTFHVVARMGAMQDAAHELGVTPGAISQRIRAVEERHGLRLFVRSKNGITLTPAGAKLHADISGAFTDIERAHTAHFDNRAGKIRISATATFAHSTLVSSLGRFTKKHPKIDVSVEVEDRQVDLRSEPVDLAIRHGLGDYPGVVSEWLCSPRMYLVGSPDYLMAHGPITTPADCLSFRLLPDASGNDWQIWLQAQGVNVDKADFGPRYGNDFLTVKAAIDGQGLALLSDLYVRESLASGALNCVLDADWPTPFAHYAVGLQETMDRPGVAALVSWLKQDLIDTPDQHPL